MKINLRLIGIEHVYATFLLTEEDLINKFNVKEITNDILTKHRIEKVESPSKEYLAQFDLEDYKYITEKSKLYKENTYEFTSFVIYNNETQTLLYVCVGNAYQEGDMDGVALESLEAFNEIVGKSLDIDFHNFNDVISLIDDKGLKIEIEVDEPRKASILIAPKSYVNVTKDSHVIDIGVKSIEHKVKDDEFKEFNLNYNKKINNLDKLELASDTGKELTIRELTNILNFRLGIIESPFPYEPYSNDEAEELDYLMKSIGD